MEYRTAALTLPPTMKWNSGPDSGGVRVAEPGRHNITPDRPGHDTGSR
jgi:hypothetical protein